MSAHCAIIEAGPATIRRLCCGTMTVVDAEMSAMSKTALAAIDDPVALVDDRPVSVESLWRDVLRSLDCGRPGRQKKMVVVHPSWWATSRVDMVAAAARVLSDGVVTRPRTWLLIQAAILAAPNLSPETAVVVEIADRFVVATGASVVAESRLPEPHDMAAKAAGVIAGMTGGATAAVLVDGPRAVAGASTLATMIVGALHRTDGDLTVMAVDDGRLPRLAAAALSAEDALSPSPSAATARGARSSGRMFVTLPVAGVALTAGALAVGVFRSHEMPPADAVPMTFLVEGRVTLTVPAHWPASRVVAGPGSARVQVTSPSDSEVALHVTQSPVGAETLNGTAERVKRAIDREPSGVFVDFDPSGVGAGRPAVTYRELRPGHDIRWTVLLDGSVRISIGCQSRPGGEDAVRYACEQAVRSARVLR